MAFTYTKRKDGRLMKRVSVGGNLITLYSDNPRDLERQYIEQKHLSNIGVVVTDENITVSTWADKWLITYKKDVAKATYKMYKSIIRLYIKPYIGNIKLKKLKQSDIIYLINKLDEKGLTKAKNNTLMTIKAILNKAIENDYIYRNVASGVTIKRHKSPEKKPLDDTTINLIKKLAESDDDVFMALFLIYTGLRRGEVIPLTYKDINIREKYINVDKAVFINTNQPELKDVKNHEARKVPIFNIILTTLKKMKKQHADDDFVFPNARNKMMSQTAIKRKHERIINKLNAVSEEPIQFTLHQLRHTFACILYKADIDVKQAQQWTGHKDLRTLLDIYTHLDSQDNQKSIDKVNQFLG